MLLPWPPLRLRETPVTAIRLLARNSEAACLTVGMVGSSLPVAGRHARAPAPRHPRSLDLCLATHQAPCGIRCDANRPSRTPTALHRHLHVGRLRQSKRPPQTAGCPPGYRSFTVVVLPMKPPARTVPAA